MLWQFGVASELSKDVHFMDRVTRVHGTSGGAIAGAMMLACPQKFECAVDYFCTREWLTSARWIDVLAPHERLLKRAITQVGIQPKASELRGLFVPHVTALRPFRNVGLDYATDDELVSAISASCCLMPAGVLIRGQKYFDGGFSDPLPLDPVLPTVAVSILRGPSIHLSPGGQSKIRFRPSPRYDISLANASALLETTILTPTRARARFDQGVQDARHFLTRWNR